MSTGMSKHEALMVLHLRAEGLEAEREFRFHPDRRWRFDFAFPSERLALEIEGGTWTQGRHSRGAGFEADCRKYCEAVCLGWRVLRVTGDQVRTGEALGYVMRALGR